MKFKNQTEAILWHLEHRGYITTFTAFRKYGCTRLSAKIFDLRRKGYNISSKPVTKTNRYGLTCTFYNYYLKKDKK